MKKILLILAGIFYLSGFSVLAQTNEKQVRDRLSSYFNSYQTEFTTPRDRCKIEKVEIDSKGRTIAIYGNELFSAQSFTEEKVKNIYKDISRLLPPPYNAYHLTVYGKTSPIEELIPSVLRGEADRKRQWGDIVYRGAPWVEKSQKPYTFTKGLQKRHLAVWASHGRFYKNERQAWEWQRPLLFCTSEDLLTQTIVVPFLIPMLENAGAYVFTPRERDWQPHEAIVDNDNPRQEGFYNEDDGKYKWETVPNGFAHRKTVYMDGENPFLDGTARAAFAVNRKNQSSEIRWTPQIPANGRYAVYVSYQTLPNSVSEAHYTVRHKGITTSFKVNQQMGGSTWVYLGTFEFEAGKPRLNYVSLSNYSNARGIVTADAVRFGGGMGRIARGDSLSATTSGMPCYLEGARYNAQWSGMPYSVYSSKNGVNDYGDDINVRSFMTNYLAGGSPYLPADSGLHVPIEMSVAVHTDAGKAPDSTFIGTLGIYTTDFNEGLLASGLSRMTSRDLCDLVMTQVCQDLTNLYGKWKRRAMYDRNYSETREPQIPSMILEVLSHQNFKDMVKGHDPMFKFYLARAIYKAIVRFSAHQHETDYCIQPLPVKDFQIRTDDEQHEMTLSWSPQNDPLEPSAKPDGYIVYTRRDGEDFDNGLFVKSNEIKIPVKSGMIYSFKVTAVNPGGESFPSATLSAMTSDNAKAKILIVNGFQRIAGPQMVQSDTAKGFDMTLDPGVPYIQSPGFCGKQIVFDPSSASLGLSGNELEQQMIAGNTFDYTYTHGKAIQSAPRQYAFTSADRSAVESGKVNLNDYNVVDLILGLQKNDGYSSVNYETLTPNLCNALREYTRMKGNLLVSGAYIARDQHTRDKQDFIYNTLKIEAYAPVKMDSLAQISGMGLTFGIYSHLNETHYATTHADCLVPTADAYSTLLFAPQNWSAAIAYPGDNYRSITMGFPFECITDDMVRSQIMGAFLKFLLER